MWGLVLLVAGGFLCVISMAYQAGKDAGRHEILLKVWEDNDEHHRDRAITCEAEWEKDLPPREWVA